MLISEQDHSKYYQAKKIDTEIAQASALKSFQSVLSQQTLPDTKSEHRFDKKMEQRRMFLLFLLCLCVGFQNNERSGNLWCQCRVLKGAR